MTQSINCRLCDSTSNHVFSKKILNKYNITYYKCSNCLSLQTESPYWIEEAYSKSNLSELDTGAAQRNLFNLAASFSIAKLLRIKNIIDIGGGDGLLTRLLRDYGLNCYSKDKFAIPTYSIGFTNEDFNIPEMVLGFEVLEHFSNPANDLEIFFKNNPSIVLLSSQIFRNQDDNWWYLTPESGQHVFFYSEKAVSLIGKKYGYNYIVKNGYILFLKNNSKIILTVASLLLNTKIIRIIRMFMAMLPTPQTWQDHLIAKNKH